MIVAALKEVVIPWTSYAATWGVCFWALARSPSPAVFVYAVLSPLPMLWYPAQDLPLGTLLLTMLVAGALIGGWLHRGRDDPLSQHGGFVLLFLLVSYFALWNSSLRYGLPLPISSANEELRYWKNYAMMLLLYFVAYLGLRTRDHLRWLVLIIVGVLLFMAWREVANFVAGGSFSYGKRANGPFWMLGLNANHFGAFVAHFSLFSLGVWAVDDAPKRRRLLLLAFVASLYPLFYSYSRGAYVAVLAGLAVLGAVRKPSLLLLLGVLAIFWQAILPSSVVDRIEMTDNPDGELEESAALRLVMWALAKSLFSDHPIWGVGFDGFAYASRGMPLHNAHNYFMQTAAEQGVIGLVMLALLFYKAIGTGWRLYRDGDTALFRGMGLGFVVCNFGVLVTNLFGDRFSELEMAGYYWLLFGAIDRARQISRASVAEAAQPQVLALSSPAPAPRRQGPGLSLSSESAPVR